LVGLELPSVNSRDEESSLEELEQLALTAGAEVVERIIQFRDRPHSATFIGPGKAEELKILADELEVDLIIFDDEISASQQHHLEEIIQRKIVDRTALILDIFAQRAHSSEGKLQVELAQLNYLLPRLTGKGVDLSRLGGGIGTRGPGETKLEVDRRRIRHRIQHLKKELKHIAQNRVTQRRRRQKAGIFSISLVGYTNAGKSTLLNLLTKAQVFVENKLFDTVGFIHKLPHQLIAAFRSTLEEVRRADLLLHIIDAAHPLLRNQIASVAQVLGELGVAGKPTIEVFNKIDLLNQEEIERLKRQFPAAVFVSALTGEGIENLLAKIEAEVLSRDTLAFAHRSLKASATISSGTSPDATKPKM